MIKIEIILTIVFTILSPFIFYFVSFLWIRWKYKLKKITEKEINFNKFEDKLNRKKTSKIYFNSINNFNKEKLNRFSINGPYGSGKSYLISFLKENILKNNDYVIVFKAWESNEIYSPFENLILKIEKIKKKWFSKKICSKFKKVVRLIIKEPRFHFKSINTYVYKYDFIKHVFRKINEFLEKENKKIYILIDEIDRCNSSDSLEFLEITNQLFENLNNIICIYSYDKKNLMSTIKNKMGKVEETYLNKFFDYEFDLIDKSYEYFITKIKELNDKDLTSIFLKFVEENSNITDNKFMNLSLRKININFNQIFNIQKWYKNKEFSDVLSLYYFVDKFYDLEKLDNSFIKMCFKKWTLCNISIFDFEIFFNEKNIYIENQEKLLINEWKDFVYLTNSEKSLEFSNLKLFIKYDFLKIENFEEYFSSLEKKGFQIFCKCHFPSFELKNNKFLFSNIEKILINLFINNKSKNKKFYKINHTKDREMKNIIIELSKLEKIFFKCLENLGNHYKKPLEAINIIVDKMFVTRRSEYLKPLHKEIKEFYDEEIKKYFINSK